MTAVEIQSGLTENTVGLLERFLEIAGTDPIAAVILVVGAVLVAFSIGVFGVLSLGGVLSWLSRAVPLGPAPSRPGQ